MRHLRRLSQSLICLLVLTACARQPFTVTQEPAVLRLVSADSCGAIVEALAEAYTEARPWVTIEVQTFNSSVAERMLRAGDVDLAFLSVVQPVAGEAPLWALPFARDGIAVIVHPETPVTEVGVAYLQEIFRGRIQEWGGTVFTIVSREEGSGTRVLFEHVVLGHHRVTHNAVVASSSEAVVAYVAQTPGAIGYVSTLQLGSAVDEGRVRLLSVEGIRPSRETMANESYPLTRQLYLADTAEPRDEAREFAQWVLGPSGQAVIQRWGGQ
jgi:phosphate transport system substrate-binding protein